LEVIQATGFVKGEINRWPELQELATGNDEVLSHPKAWPNLQPGDDLSGDAHVPFFVKHTSGKYYDLAAELKMDNPQITRGIAIADIDHDGKLDFATANQWEESNLYCNRNTNTYSFLGLALKYPLSPQSNAEIKIDADSIPARFAVGAVARITLPNGKKLVSFVDGGNGHTGKNSNEILFGLHQTARKQPLEVEIDWRNSAGKLKTAKVTLQPGWHTLMLPY